MSVAQAIIGVAEFSHELTRICLRTGQGFPSRLRHQHIVLGGVTLSLPADRSCTEQEINERLRAWLRDVGPGVEIDHVSLRRRLVDHGYLVRDDAGVTYRVRAQWARGLFASEVERLDPVALVAEAAAARERRKRAHLLRTDE